jgi:predicted unusual protein kinase regulating ubiquinone biosynthesis (AarF/ABC1/UbiB family)
VATDDDDDQPARTPPTSAPPTSAPTVGRFSRFAKLTGLSAGVAARHITQRVKGAFADDEHRVIQEKAAQQRSASQVTKTLGELKGAAMKIGQMLATDPELLPPEMVAQLSQLQHSAPAMDFATVRDVVEQALDRPLEDAFESFSQTPIGAASIGQVHRARTRAPPGAEGVDVAVKVQYPGIADTIRSDMKNLGSLLVMARAAVSKERVDSYLQEITEVIEKESDYLAEADNLERFQIVLKNVEGMHVPIPMHELSRKNVLVMEYFAGTRLDEWLLSASSEHKTVQGRRLLRAYLEMIHRHGALHADPHPGNFLVLQDGSIGLLDLGCVRDYPLAFMDEMLRLLSCLWKHDIDALQASWRRLGFMDKGVDPEMVYEWLALLFDPLTTNKMTDFGTWKIQEDAMHFVLDNPSIKLWAPPREVLFYVRVLAGLRALMHKVGMKLNVYELARAISRERGII